jgi:hypothetical protein
LNLKKNRVHMKPYLLTVASLLMTSQLQSACFQ